MRKSFWSIRLISMAVDLSVLRQAMNSFQTGLKFDGPGDYQSDPERSQTVVRDLDQTFHKIDELPLILNVVA